MNPNPPCCVRTVGLIQGQPYHSTPLTKQGDVMLTVVIGGRGRVVTETTEYVVRRGMVGLVPGSATGVLMSDPDDPYVHYYCRFAGGYARELTARISDHHLRPFFPAPDVLGLADRLHRHGRINRLGLPERCGPEGLDVIAILERLADATINRDPSPDQPPAERLRAHLFEHVAEPTVLNRIAADLGVSRATLARLARTATGCSVQQLHERTKMEWAAQLLRSTRSTVGEIARRVGYADPFYFSRVFRAFHGVSPREYVRRWQRAQTG